MIILCLSFCSGIVMAHPGHGDYYPEEVTSPQSSGSSSASSSSGSSSGSSSNSFDSKSKSIDSASHDSNSADNGGKNNQVNNTTQNKTNITVDSEDNGVSLEQIAILVIVFIVVFGLMVLLFKLKILK